MPDVAGGQPVPLKEGLFERKNTEKTVERAPHHRQAVLTPSPYLRSHQINDRDAHPLQPASQAQVKIGTIRENGDFGTAAFYLAEQFPVLAVDSGNVPEHLDQANDG